LPVTDRLDLETLGRVEEAVRIHRMVPGSRIIFSGGPVFDPMPNAGVMADVAGILGIEEADMALETVSRDTEEEARLIRGMVGGDRFALVTSASHMPRAMALFRKQGMDPITAPANHMVKEREEGAEALKMAQTAVYEYLGIIWAWMRGSADYAD